MTGGPSVRGLFSGLTEGPFSARRTLWLAAFALVLTLSLALHAGAANAATPPQALILGDSVSAGTAPDSSGDSIEQYEAIQDGFQTTVVDGATWDSMTASQFAQYQVVIIGDPTCGFDNFQAAVTNESVWEPVVMGSGGNKVIIGTDPTYHYLAGHPGGATLEGNGIAYAGAVSGATGAYVDLSCTYSGAAPDTPVPLLDGLSSFGPGSFTVGGAPCAGSISIIAATGPTNGLADGDLSDWECSVHEFFDHFPADYTPLALATDPSVPVTYTGTDVTTGASVSGSPYIMLSGSGVSITSNLSLAPASQTLTAGTSGTVTATLVDSTSAPVANASVVFDVTSGPDAGKTFTGTTNSSGQVAFTYTNSGTAGTDSVLATYTNPDSVIEQGTATITWIPSTSVTTSLSGGSQSGTSISVQTGTAVTDTAKLAGTNASGATGTVMYDVYSDSGCTTLVSTGTAESITTPGTLPASQAVTLSTAGTYYWKATYSGDANDGGSSSTCGSTGEVETVTAPPVAVSKPVVHCPAASGALSGSTVGVFSIGMTQTQARTTLTRFTVTQNKFDNFCLFEGWGIRLGYPSPALLKSIKASQRAQYSGHVVLALTANPFYALNGARPGMSIASVAKRLHASKPFHVGHNDWYFVPAGTETGVLKVRRGTIQEVGLASLALTKTRALQRVFINSFNKLM